MICDVCFDGFFKPVWLSLKILRDFKLMPLILKINFHINFNPPFSTKMVLKFIKISHSTSLRDIFAIYHVFYFIASDNRP